MGRTKTSPSAASELRSHTGFWLRFVSNHVSQTFARKLLDSGVTVAEWVVLREMYGRDEMSPSMLAETMGMTRGAASKLVDRLVAKKLVSREERTDDRRYQDIALTSAGRRVVPALAAIADRNDEEYFAPLPAREHEALVSTLKKLVQAHGLHKIPIE
ncbi:MAG: MarR family winged helix-turn-helix transcriptional regulator [Candidatus Acidiferrum sp.]|jgi:DNA-binding MarR family transcriptional regulator